MTDQLPADKLEKLLPALRHVAELVQEKGEPNKEDLQLLLLASGMDEDWAISELERWAKVLVAVRGKKDEGKREIAVRALMLRGVPEALAKLAVEIASSPQPSKPKVLPIAVNRDAIGFGELQPGQAAEATIVVSGGPGRVKVSSDMVTVEPETFGPDETVVKVKVKGGIDGQVLRDALILESEKESVKVDIIARWVAPRVEREPTVAVSEAKVEVFERQKFVPSKVPAFSLRGYFVLPDLIEQGMVQRLGRGYILDIFLLSHNLILVVSRGGAGLFDLNDGKALWEIDCPAQSGAISPDGSMLALASGNEIVIWCLTEGNVLRRMKGHKG
ncbi:MAG: hypothetical protein NZ805_12220 [Armatimonadetes bacterium]|nr:hypothetical protein [Armatimonadota bacterium]MDW8028125.1 hypothetical protein [Armatimonadota bacterium]